MPPYYQARERADAPASFDTSLPRVTDIGPALGNIGKTAMTLAEPILQHQAAEQAIEDAGAASIVRTPEGQYVRSNLTHGGGLTYAKAYGDALDERQYSMMTQDYASKLDTTAQAWADDPQHQDPKQFWAFASGQAQAMLEAAPLSMRAKLDSRLSQLMGDSVRGFSEGVHSTQRKQLYADLSQSLTNVETNIGNLARSDGSTPDLEKRISDQLGDGLDIIGKMKSAGFIGDSEPYALGLAGRTYDERSYATGAQAMLGFGSILSHLSNEQLARVQVWGDGSDDHGTITVAGDGGKPHEMSREEFSQSFGGNARWMGAAGALAGRVLNDKIAAANQQAMIEAMQQPSTVTADQVISDFTEGTGNFLPSSGMSKPDYAAALQQYGSHGNIADQLRDPGRRQATLAFLAGSGTVPGGAAFNSSLRAMTFSSDPASQQAALDFIWNARDVTTKGAWTGLNWFNNLPDDLKAVAQFDSAMRRAGFNTVMELKDIYARTQGRLAGRNDIVGQFGRETDYEAAANKAVADEFGVKPADLGPSAAILRSDFDRYMQINANLYPTKEQALQASAAMLSTGWAKSDIFIGGVGDKRLIGEGIPTWFMDKALAVYPELRSGNPTGATFGNGRVKIQSLNDSPTKGYPTYSFVYFNDQGNVLGRGAVYPMQRIVNAWHDYVGQQRAEVEREARANMAPPVWKLVKEDGRVFYKDNGAEYAAWAERQRAAAAKRTQPTDSKLGSINAPQLPMHGRDY